MTTKTAFRSAARPGGLAVAALLWLMPLPSAAQSPLVETLPATYREPYAALLADPGNTELLYGLARRAEADAAAGAAGAPDMLRLAATLYERSLVIAPDQPQILLRLAEVHYRLGNAAEARSYFERALVYPDVPADIRTRAERYLDALDEELSPHRVWGSFMAGIRHQSNATAGPESGEAFGFIQTDDIRANFTGPVDEDLREQEDQDFFASLQLNHAYDPGWQRGHTLDSRLSLYGTRHLDRSELDTLYGELTSGPRFDLSSYGWGESTVRPHAIGRLLAADDHFYAADFGGGVEADRRFGERTLGRAELTAVYQVHDKSDLWRDAEDRDGMEYEGEVSLDHALHPRVAVGGALNLRRVTAEDDADKSWRYGLRLRGRVHYPPPFGIGAGDWATGLELAYDREEFDEPDDEITPFETREDDRWRAWLIHEVPVAGDWSLVAGGGYTRRESTLINFDYDNWEVSLGAAYRF